MESVKLQESSEGSRYYPGYKAAQMLGISSHLLSRLTGSLYVLKGPKEADLEHAGRINIGLNLKVIITYFQPKSYHTYHRVEHS